MFCTQNQIRILDQTYSSIRPNYRSFHWASDDDDDDDEEEEEEEEEEDLIVEANIREAEQNDMIQKEIQDYKEKTSYLQQHKQNAHV